MYLGLLLTLCLVSYAAADLRMASQPSNGNPRNVEPTYQLTNQGTVPWKLTPWKGQMHYRYMEPSTFNYKGLEYQKKRNYDNFLRSNVDNEQDNRNFNDEDGKDHLPFRTMESETYAAHKVEYGTRYGIKQIPREIPLAKEVKPGETMLVPLRWNNPHASEMEINVWIFQHAGEKPIVVPIRKPSCSGEGYQDNIVSFTVPKDFDKLGEKIPGFTGCNEDSKPMCTLQIYSHSVESRTYSIGFPIIIPGHKSDVSAKSVAIEEATQDPWWDLSGLRELCLPAWDPSANIESAQPRWARQVSDVFNHAYQNSDYSPYSGQQHESISKNLHASAINKMEVGNRGELGKSILSKDAYNRLRYLRGLENKVYKNYEALANKIIQRLGNQMKNTSTMVGTFGSQQLATCFRCAETGSTNTNRLQTNTYIPSFQLPTSLVATARKYVPSKYSGLITESGVVQIYVAAYTDLLPFYYKSRHLGLIYQDSVAKMTMTTKSDATNFKKRDANGKADGGKYAALEAKKTFVAERGCPKECLYVKPKTLLLEQAGAGGVEAILEEQAKASPFAVGSDMKIATAVRPVTVKYDLGDNMWIVGCQDGRWLKMVLIKITSANTYKWIATRYRRYDRRCSNPKTFVKECFAGTDPRRDAYLVIPPFVRNEKADDKGSDDKLKFKSANKAWFCVANVNQNLVKGPYHDLERAKAELNKVQGSQSNRQQICEMSSAGAKADPHWVGNQHQGAGTNAGFNVYWYRGWNDIRHMNNMCNQAVGCKYKIPMDTIEKPLYSGSMATNVTGPCKKCLQFFGKHETVHPFREPKVSPLAKSITDSGGREPSAVSGSTGRNPDDTFEGTTTGLLQETSGRRRRRTAGLLQGGEQQKRKKRTRSNGHKLNKVGEFLDRMDNAQPEDMGLEVLDDVVPLPEL